MASQKDVQYFHEVMNGVVRTIPTLIEGEELEFRKTLIEEESEELLFELENFGGRPGTLQRVAKESADLLYVLYGLALHCGYDLDRVFEAVHQSNMNKLWPCKDCGGRGYSWDGESFSEDAGGKLVDACITCHGDGKVVRYRADGKVLKPPSYEPPNLDKIIPKE